MKNNENKSGKLRFNVIDVLIIVLILACLTAMVLRFTVLDNLFENKSEKEYLLTFKVDSLTYSQYEAILLAVEESEIGGNWVFFSDGTTELGTLQKLGEQNTETLRFDKPNGDIVYAKYSDSENEEDVTWSITGTIACSGVYNENKGFLLNGKKYISSNSEIDVFTKYCDFKLTVLGIEEASKR